MIYDPKSVLDAAVTMEPGEKIIIPCRSETELSSFITRLYRERNKMEKSILRDDARCLVFKRTTKQGRFLIVIEKEAAISHAYIISKDGEVKLLPVPEPPPPPLPECDFPMDDFQLPRLEEDDQEKSIVDLLNSDGE